MEVGILPNDGSIPLKTATLRKISVIFRQRWAKADRPAGDRVQRNRKMWHSGNVSKLGTFGTYGKLKSKPSILLKVKATSPTPMSASMKTAAILPPVRSIACVSPFSP